MVVTTLSKLMSILKALLTFSNTQRMSDGIWFQEQNTSTTVDKLKIEEQELNTLRKAYYLLDEIKVMLREKNTAYGDSALNPIRLFSRSDAIDAICIRIDDKLSRISTMGIDDKAEDTIKDLIGYLILLQIAKERKGGQ